MSTYKSEQQTQKHRTNHNNQSPNTQMFFHIIFAVQIKPRKSYPNFLKLQTNCYQKIYKFIHCKYQKNNIFKT